MCTSRPEEEGSEQLKRKGAEMGDLRGGGDVKRKKKCKRGHEKTSKESKAKATLHESLICE